MWLVAIRYCAMENVAMIFAWRMYPLKLGVLPGAASRLKSSTNYLSDVRKSKFVDWALQSYEVESRMRILRIWSDSRRRAVQFNVINFVATASYLGSR